MKFVVLAVLFIAAVAVHGKLMSLCDFKYTHLHVVVEWLPLLRYESKPVW